MFGGLCFLFRGRLCCGIVGSDLMVRVSRDEYEATVRKPHVRPWDFTGKLLRGIVHVSPAGFRTRSALRAWLSRGKRVAQEKAREE
jgi:TfoX N-terminal domain